IRQGEEKLVATMLATMMNMPPSAPKRTIRISGCLKSAEGMLLPGAQRRRQEAGSHLLAKLVFLFARQGTTFGAIFVGKGRGQTTDGTADFTILKQDGLAPVNSRRDRMIIVGHLPKDAAIRSLFDVFLGESRNLLIAIQDEANFFAAV